MFKTKKLTDYPLLAAQYSTNNTEPVDQIFAKSSKLRWWQCPDVSHHIWETKVSYRTKRPDYAQCPICSGERLIAGENSFADKYPELVSSWHPDNKLKPTEVLPGSGKKIKWICGFNHVWETIVDARRRTGCPYCAGHLSTPERNLIILYPELVKEWSSKNTRQPDSFTPKANTFVWWICPKSPLHEYEMKIIKRTHYGRGCPYCAGKRVCADNNLAFLYPELAKEWSIKNEKKPEEFTANANVRVWWTCLKNSNHEDWGTWIYCRTNGESKCPKCVSLTSEAQQEVADFISSLGFQVELNHQTSIGPHQIDVYLPELKLGIEYNGLYFHRASHRGSSYHLNKLKLCEEAGIRLITIFEDEWLSKEFICKAYLSSILGKCENKIGARKTQLKPISWPEASSFLETHHIQGRCAPPKVSLGLCCDSELLAVATFVQTLTRVTPKLRKTSQRWELTRYCVKSGIQIIGGFQKLMKKFIDEFRPELIISFSDKRWSIGGLYKRAGFELAETLKPSYWYFKSKIQREHKSKYQKARIVKLFGPMLKNETEAQAMERLGYHRIYDCGLNRWELKL